MMYAVIVIKMGDCDFDVIQVYRHKDVSELELREYMKVRHLNISILNNTYVASFMNK